VSHTNCDSGHACRWEWYRQFIDVWVLNYITTSVNILWGFQYSVMCVMEQIVEFVIAIVAKP